MAKISPEHSIYFYSPPKLDRYLCRTLYYIMPTILYRVFYIIIADKVMFVKLLFENELLNLITLIIYYLMVCYIKLHEHINSILQKCLKLY